MRKIIYSAILVMAINTGYAEPLKNDDSVLVTESVQVIESDNSNTLNLETQTSKPHAPLNNDSPIADLNSFAVNQINELNDLMGFLIATTVFIISLKLILIILPLINIILLLCSMMLPLYSLNALPPNMSKLVHLSIEHVKPALAKFEAEYIKETTGK